MIQQYERRLKFEGAINFRDLGGYPAADGRRTRWRRLFRSDSLADMSEMDLQQLADLALRGLVDFRTEDERVLKPNRLPEGACIRVLELGFLPAGTLEMLEQVRAGTISAQELERKVISQYRKFGVDHVEEYRRALNFATEADNYPLLIHCTSGKDRTGFASALLLLAVGVPRDIVLQDYDLTNLYRRDVSHLFGPKTQEDIISLLLSAQAHYLEAALEEIDRVYGSFDAYLTRTLQVDEIKRARLVELLTDA
jgi:protein-tyrosine phosphatase